jgi:SAM-dependent methyltransferase
MMAAVENDITARRGNPSFVWRAGQQRRLDLVKRYVSLQNASILDAGCGIGLYIQQFARLSNRVYGIDVEIERVAQAKTPETKVCVASAEALPFLDQVFDVVFSHEVLEHVGNDRSVLTEATRVTRMGGHIVIFAPNRLFPFETHGIYIGGQYHFGNFPLVNYLPDILRSRLCPHVRAYTAAHLRRLWQDLPVTVVTHQQVYPGFDNVATRRPWLSHALRKSLYLAENTPLACFGLSHFVVLRVEGPSSIGLERGHRKGGD